MAETGDQDKAGQEKKSTGIVAIFIFFGILLIGIVGGTAWYLIQQNNGQANGSIKIPHFMKMEPFIITLKSESRPHYLQIKLSLMSRSSESLTKLEIYRPMIRNELIMYLNSLDYTTVLKPEATDLIRLESITSINNLLVKEQVGITVDDLIITDLVIQ